MAWGVFYFMKIIRCKNVILEALKPCQRCKIDGLKSDCPDCRGSGYINDKTAGRRKECGRIIGFLTDLQFDMLKVDKEGTIFRCPACSSDQRWSKIYWDAESKQLVYTLIQNPDMSNFSNINYDKLDICEQVG